MLRKDLADMSNASFGQIFDHSERHLTDSERCHMNNSAPAAQNVAMYAKNDSLSRKRDNVKKGKGHFGVCWKCGQSGHNRANCPTR